LLSAQQLNQLKEQLIEEKNALETYLQGEKEGSLENVAMRHTTGELSMYDNHPADTGTDLYERTKDFALEEHHDSQMDKVNAALQAVEEGSYGKCKVCGGDIPFERLEVLPYTLYCKEHSPEQHIPGDRPVEEDVLEPAHGNTFQHHQFREVVDDEDSFQEVARWGTSETPSDLRGDYEDYNSLYNEGHDDEGFTEDYETFIGNNLEGTQRIVYPSKKHEEYEAMLDEAGTDTPFFDLPFDQTDGYVEEDKH